MIWILEKDGGPWHRKATAMIVYSYINMVAWSSKICMCSGLTAWCSFCLLQVLTVKGQERRPSEIPPGRNKSNGTPARQNTGVASVLQNPVGNAYWLVKRNSNNELQSASRKEISLFQQCFLISGPWLFRTWPLLVKQELGFFGGQSRVKSVSSLSGVAAQAWTKPPYRAKSANVYPPSFMTSSKKLKTLLPTLVIPCPVLVWLLLLMNISCEHHVNACER